MAWEGVNTFVLFKKTFLYFFTVYEGFSKHLEFLTWWPFPWPHTHLYSIKMPCLCGWSSSAFQIALFFYFSVLTFQSLHRPAGDLRIPQVKSTWSNKTNGLIWWAWREKTKYYAYLFLKTHPLVSGPLGLLALLQLRIKKGWIHEKLLRESLDGIF